MEPVKQRRTAQDKYKISERAPQGPGLGQRTGNGSRYEQKASNKGDH